MPREGIPYGGAICRLRERIGELFDLVGQKLHSINGVEGDGQGNVQIVSGDPAVVITDDQLQHEIEISLDTSQLPAAAVSSVNGQTGAVALTADDIPSDNGDVQTDIDNLEAADTTLQGNINAEALARQNADSTLQTNINAANAAISLKVGGSGNIGSDTKPIKIVNGDAVAVTDALTTAQDVQNTLNAYLPMVRTTGNQTIDGVKTFNQRMICKASGGYWTSNSIIDWTTTPGSNNYQFIADGFDKNNVEIYKQVINDTTGYRAHDIVMAFYDSNNVRKEAVLRIMATRGNNTAILQFYNGSTWSTLA